MNAELSKRENIFVTFALIFVFGCTGFGFYDSWRVASQKVDAFKSYSIGTGVSATFIQGGFGSMRTTQIVTTKGTYLVSGAFSITKDNPLTVTLKGTSEQVCDTLEKRCANLVGK